jgi:hypothetical protein
MNAAVVITVFWLLIDAGGRHDTPVFVPEPYNNIEDCIAGGNAFKESTMDALEEGEYVCIPQRKE